MRTLTVAGASAPPTRAAVFESGAATVTGNAPAFAGLAPAAGTGTVADEAAG
ncbi:hypothetical protein Raf01_32080 [Rugosimonospora africana]|uniref:Uncharacterized protein n=1 Tax=Rugosimonospora africana TaxID=556532 RepID=A0A8J3QUF3_9ACTN|nr:hypothetical protein Raf01_32080 [Rugosimonospora africana]